MEVDESLFAKKLKELLQITVEFDGKYYVFFQNEWVEFRKENRADSPKSAISPHNSLSIVLHFT